MATASEERVWVKLDISSGAFDLLLDRSANGLLLPLSPPGEKGGCNIVIRGRPGSGKSTLALQLARAICRADWVYDSKGRPSPCRYFSVYASLEHSPEAVLEHARAFGWKQDLWPVQQLTRLPEIPSQEELGHALGQLLLGGRPQACGEGAPRPRGPKLWPEPGPVLVPRLSPRSLKGDPKAAQEVFWQRYREIEYLLQAGAWLPRLQDDHKKLPPELKLVVLDSLNVFGDLVLEREQLFRLFDVFSRHGVVGVFVVEEREFDEQIGPAPFHYNTVEYLSDVVIALDVDDPQGYLVKTFEIVKCRYQNHRFGKHPFKLLGVSDRTPQRGVVIYPSLHTHLSEAHGNTRQGSGSPGNGKERGPYSYCLDSSGKPLGYSGFRALDRMGDFDPRRASCLAVVGARATYKSVIGKNFALRGVVCGEDALLVTLKERPEPLDEKPFDFSQDVFDRINDDRLESYPWPGPEKRPALVPLPKKQQRPVILGDSKAGKRCYGITNHPDMANFGILCLMNFVPGMLLPEEFVAELLHEIEPPVSDGKGARANRKPITRVVIDDVATIGVSYPFLQQSPTSGSLFLTAVVDLLKSRGISVMLIAGESQEPGCKMVADRVLALADAIIRCDSHDVFGQRYVGVIGKSPGRVAAPVEFSVPGVIEQVLPGEHLYRINEELLQGLVGFETDRIERPGASLYVFQEESVAHLRYTANLRVLLQHAFGQPPEGNIREPRVSVQVFGSPESGAVHDSLDVLGDKPIDRTVVVTVDEFWTEAKDPPSLEELLASSSRVKYDPDDSLVPLTEKRIEGIPYYDNVLLLAYRWDGLGSSLQEVREAYNHRWGSWSQALEIADKIVKSGRTVPPVTRLFDFDSSAEETFSCVFLDLLLDMRAGNRGSHDLAALFDGSPLEKLPDKRAAEQLLGRALADYSALSEAEQQQLLNAINATVPVLLPQEITHDTPAEQWRKIDSARGLAVRHLLATSAIDAGRSVDSPAVRSFIDLFGSRLDDENLPGQARYLPDAELGPLLPNAAVYCCWYSQLRDLIARNPELSGELDVVCLPHRGFRGDWFLGVVKGSVSLRLGEDLINILCTRSEEYKRFADGVGLPTRHEFRGQDFQAWPGNTECKLSDVLNIHANALSRSRIPGYRSFRQVLINRFKQLVGYQAPQRDAASVLGSIAQYLDMLAGP